MAAEGHGHTIAAWTAVAIMLTAFLVGALGLMAGSWPTFWAGVILFAVGGVVGKVLQLLGFGQSVRH